MWPEERAERLQKIYLEVSERDPSDWPRLLDAACGGDEELRAEVEDLLRYSLDAAGFLSGPAVVEGVVKGDGSKLNGRRIGKYEVVRALGRGGMGAVFLARRADREFDSEVAIKLVWPGFDQQQVVERFRLERQILARLSHPNIARLLDGGTTEDGWPYLVMEYVDGVPITEYCQRERLTVAERLHLFTQVCEAVEFAHHQSIVHRDLKPGNIFVERSRGGQVKLLDFGIAKILDQTIHPGALSLTQPGMLAMTPEYASPEQVRGEPVTPASDIYSLGMVLYELLTGVNPIRFAGLRSRPLHEVTRAICEEEPLRPSLVWGKSADGTSPSAEAAPDNLSQRGPVTSSRATGSQAGGAEPGTTTFDAVFNSRLEDTPAKLCRRLRGDLDSIVTKAIDKQPSGRYQSVGELCEEIRRYFAGLPVQARQGVVAYGVRRFLRRHLGLTVLAGMVVTLAAGWMFQTVRQYRIEREEARLGLERAYPAQLLKVQETLKGGDLEQAEATLSEIRREPAGFEWRYLWHTIKADMAGFRDDYPYRNLFINQAGNRVLTVACPPAVIADQRQLLYFNCVMRLRRMTGETIASLPIERPIVRADIREKTVEGAAGDHFVVRFDEDDCSRYIEVDAAGRIVDTAQLDEGTLPVMRINHSPLYVRQERGGALLIRDAENRALLARLSAITERVDAVLTTRDGLLLTNSGRGLLRLWDWSTGRLLAEVQEEDEIARQSLGQSSHRILVTIGRETVRVRDLRTLRRLGDYRRPGFDVSFAAFFGQSENLIVGFEDGLIETLIQPGLRLTASVRAHSDWVNFIGNSPDVRRLFSGGNDRLVQLLDPVSLRVLGTLRGHRGSVIGGTFSADGRSLITFDDTGGARIWNEEAIKETEMIDCGQGPLFAVAFSSDSRRIATAGRDGTARLFDALNGRELAVLSGHHGRVLDLTFSPDGRQVATSGEDKTVRLHDTSSGKETLLIDDHSKQIHGLAFSPDGKILVSASDDLSVRFRDPVSGRELRRLPNHPREVLTVAFSPDGRTLATGSADNKIRLWDVATARLLRTLDGHFNWVWSVRFSPDGRQLASGSRDKTAIIWDPATGARLSTLKGHFDEIFSVDFLPDGSRLATAGNDKTVRLWDPASGRELLTLREHTDQVWSVAFSPNGRNLASAAWDGRVRFYRW